MMNIKIDVPRPLELAIIYNCNLACDGCSHFSDQKHNWSISLQQVDKWLSPWSKIVNPDFFSVLGGEPTLHNDLCEILKKCRMYFPGDFLFTTNAFFLHKHLDLECVLFEYDIKLKVAVHSDDSKYLRQVGKNLETVKTWQKRGLEVLWAELQTEGWRKNYKGTGSDMLPFDDKSPRSSWEACPCRCYQIVDGKIWKCPQIAYLSMQYAKYKMGDEWLPYLQWEPLSLDSSFKDKVEFFQREEEFICGMCPAKTNYIKRGSPQ